jgi:hypothetical protein
MLTASDRIPSIGDQVEQNRVGVTRVGRVWYADQLQVLVKWDDGNSSSLRVGRDRFRIRSRPRADALSAEREVAREKVLLDQNAA